MTTPFPQLPPRWLGGAPQTVQDWTDFNRWLSNLRNSLGAPGPWTTYPPTLTMSAGAATISFSNCRSSQFGTWVSVRGHLTFTVSAPATYATIGVLVSPLDNNATAAVSMFSVSASVACPCLFNDGLEFVANFEAGVTYDAYFQGLYEAA